MVSRCEGCHPRWGHSDDVSCVRISSPVDSAESRAKTIVFVGLPWYCVVLSDPTDLPPRGAALIRAAAAKATTVTANNPPLSWLQKGMNYLKSHPITISVNEIFCRADYLPSFGTNTICDECRQKRMTPPAGGVAVSRHLHFLQMGSDAPTSQIGAADAKFTDSSCSSAADHTCYDNHPFE